MQIFSENVQKLWGEWEVEWMVLVSLFLQTILIFFSNRRKYTAGVWVRILIWSAYLSGDWVATVCLGTLSNKFYSSDGSKNEDDRNRSALQAFWAPFLLLHLGGPGTITAYSLEDNELWLRHLLGLLVQVAVAFYVFLMSWGPQYPLSLMSIPMFVVGIIKYGERTWVLRSASKKHFGDPLRPAPDPGPDYPLVVKEFGGDDMQKTYEFILRDMGTTGAGSTDDEGNRRSHFLGRKYIDESRFLFEEQLRHLYADLILSSEDRRVSESIIRSLSPHGAFRVVETELSFLYDVLHTKAALLIYSPLLAILLRTITFLSTVSTCVAFTFFMDDKHDKLFPKVDIIITYTLLFGAIVLDIYAFFLMVMSDWSTVWFNRGRIRSSIYRATIASFSSSSVLQSLCRKRYWCKRMGQRNLIDSCLRDKTKYNHDHNSGFFFNTNELLERYWYLTWVKVDEEMIEQPIFRYLLEMTEGVEDVKKLLRHRGDYVIAKKGETVSRLLGWSIVDVEFDHSILLWHIATDLYSYDHDDSTKMEDHIPPEPSSRSRSRGADRGSNRKISKCLSEYMMYLLVMCPFMLPKGLGEFRFRDTCSEAKRFFEQRRSREVSAVWRKKAACRSLMEVETEVEPKEVKGDKSKSMLFEACRLAKMLKSQLPVEMGSGERWEMISRVWVEMLCYAASHCGWTQHGQQLRRGGELLTHVCLLMSHLGLSDQFQILSGQVNFVPSDQLGVPDDVRRPSAEEDEDKLQEKTH